MNNKQYDKYIGFAIIDKRLPIFIIIILSKKWTIIIIIYKLSPICIIAFLVIILDSINEPLNDATFKLNYIGS